MADALLIIAQKNFRDEELAETKKALESAGKTCQVASIAIDMCAGMLGARVTPDLTVKDALNKNYKAVVVIGGSGSPALAKHTEVIKIIQKAYSAGKIVAAICAGPVVLAEAGVLNGKKATIFSDRSLVAAISSAGAKYISKSVVIDNNIITADGPKSARVFGEVIARLI